MTSPITPPRMLTNDPSPRTGGFHVGPLTESQIIIIIIAAMVVLVAGAVLVGRSWREGRAARAAGRAAVPGPLSVAAGVALVELVLGAVFAAVTLV